MAVAEAIRGRYSVAVEGMSEKTSIRLVGVGDLPPETWSDPMFAKASSICFDQCTFVGIPPGIEACTNIESLTFANCANIKSFDENMPVSLQRICIVDCPSLEALPPKMAGITHCTIERCSKLARIRAIMFSPAILRSLVIGECPRLERIPDFFDKTPALTNLCVSKCPMVKAMPASFGALSKTTTVRATKNGPDWPLPTVIMRGPRAIRQHLNSIQSKRT